MMVHLPFKQTGGCGGRIRERGEILGGYKYIVNRLLYHLDFQNVLALPCVLAKFFYLCLYA